MALLLCCGFSYSWSACILASTQARKLVVPGLRLDLSSVGHVVCSGCAFYASFVRGIRAQLAHMTCPALVDQGPEADRDSSCHSVHEGTIAALTPVDELCARLCMRSSLQASLVRYTPTLTKVNTASLTTVAH
jgi:hypothetical protein